MAKTKAQATKHQTPHRARLEESEKAKREARAAAVKELKSSKS